MDSTLAAGWIAFWGAVRGAVVGGGLTAVATWATTRGQCKREHTFRQRERLGDMLAQGRLVGDASDGLRGPLVDRLGRGRKGEPHTRHVPA
jgi:hypothetical protein